MTSPYKIPTPNSHLTNPSFSPQMTTRVQHDIFKSNQLLNIHLFSSTQVSHFPINYINELQDHNWKMSMK